MTYINESTNVISFNKTIVGWINFTVAGVMKYNINPVTFRNITGVSEQAELGTCELSPQELKVLKEDATYIGLADGWHWVESDEVVI